MIKLTNRDGIKLSKNEIILLDFIEHNTETFLKMPINQLADELKIATGSVSRLVKKLNHNNYQSFKIYVAELNTSIATHSPDDQMSGLVKKANQVFNHYYFAIKNNYEMINIELLEKSIKWIYKTKSILVFGIHSSYSVARELGQGLATLGFESHVSNSVHEVILSLRNKYLQETMCIMFSKTVSSKENRYIIQIAEKFKIKVLLITENTKITNTENRLVLRFASLSQERRVNALSSRVAQLFYGDIILKVLEETLILKNVNNQDLYDNFKDTWINGK
ncbi:hypothetical protein CJJ23_03885 [Mycoplasmopsis agassizii]|uniref:HTH rpiR-type domain-containing protein n=1 Tax=Mycoplasmopsis agassizii TaxID=33922 RepID=A0A269THT5_9BACT|nr:MurR/RpiR family transcriptional regulator [Mycoplasmopsis agassizii]PAK21043.1 hypothetical protein CJJ23_03885 [Mycoplasmopsis agassizii]